MKNILFICALIMTSITAMNMAQADTHAMDHPPKAVVFYADTCGACKVIDPKMKDALSKINKDRIEIVIFDFSDRDKINETRTIAKEKGVEATLLEYGAKTGFVVVLNKQGEEVGKITVNSDINDIILAFTSVM